MNNPIHQETARAFDGRKLTIRQYANEHQLGYSTAAERVRRAHARGALQLVNHLATGAGVFTKAQPRDSKQLFRVSIHAAEAGEVYACDYCGSLTEQQIVELPDGSIFCCLDCAAKHFNAKKNEDTNP